MMDEQLKLENIRNVLIRQEETIIFALIERAQYKINDKVYRSGEFEFPDFTGSYCDYFMYLSECLHSRFRRFTTPEEHPYFKDLPEPIIDGEVNEAPIIDTDININDTIKKIYVENVIPYVCINGDDGQYGSSVFADIHCLQALSKRIHYGMFVAESKFLNEPDEYTKLIKVGDRDGIMAKLTDSAVEERLLARVKLKAATYGQDPGDIQKNYKIEPTHVAEIYRKWIIPLTKDVEVDYLMLRA